jgi:hypothetical protein
MIALGETFNYFQFGCCPGCYCCGTRASTPVVWQSCNNGVVDAFMAKRGFCYMGIFLALFLHQLQQMLVNASCINDLHVFR